VLVNYICDFGFANLIILAQTFRLCDVNYLKAKMLNYFVFKPVFCFINWSCSQADARIVSHKVIKFLWIMEYKFISLINNNQISAILLCKTKTHMILDITSQVINAPVEVEFILITIKKILTCENKVDNTFKLAT
jgi:hypothetical protein